MPSSIRSISPFAVASIPLAVLIMVVSGCPDVAQDDRDRRDRSCNVDSECDDGFICQRELRRCVCTSDEACPDGLFCNAFTGQCVDSVPGCTKDSDCQGEQYCEVATRTCRTRRSFCEPCASHVECGTQADKCLLDPTNNRRYCGRSCTQDTDCPDGAACQTVAGERTCWPIIATCEQLKGCNPSSGQLCAQNEDCTEGEDQVCEVTQGICVARVPTCPYGMVCGKESRQCEAACVTDDDCYASDPGCDPDASPCRCVNNECASILVCREDTDCQAGHVCLIATGQTEGECRPDCAGDSARCPQGMVCISRGQRHDCVPGCTGHADCSVGENCIAGACKGLSSAGRQHCQMPEVCELCEACQSDPAAGNTCQRVAGTCQTCSAPAGGCSTVGGGIYCCAIFTNTAYRGIDCTGGKLCPAGHQCVEMGGTDYSNCFPTSDSVCDSASCRQ